MTAVPHSSSVDDRTVRRFRVSDVVRRVIGAGFFVLLAVLTFWAWPTRYGGSSTVVVVSGNSMEPTLSSDDMVFARAADSYAVGDVVVYPVSTGGVGDGRLVIHRIIGGNGVDGFVTRGDNRASDDPWNPTADDVLGKMLWVGGDAQWLRTAAALLLSPWLWSLFVGAVVFWVARSWVKDLDDDTPDDDLL